jgi:hypothetical protein
LVKFGLKPTMSSSFGLSRRGCARADPVHLERLRDDAADGHPGIEGRVGILEDDLHLAPHPAQVLAAELRELLAHEA